jgi:hypothetical protein
MAIARVTDIRELPEADLVAGVGDDPATRDGAGNQRAYRHRLCSEYRRM